MEHVFAIMLQIATMEDYVELTLKVDVLIRTLCVLIPSVDAIQALLILTEYAKKVSLLNSLDKPFKDEWTFIKLDTVKSG